MDNTDDVRIRLEDIIEVHEVSAVNIGEVRFVTCDRRYSIEDINGGVAEVIDDGDIVALLHEFDGGM